MGDEDGGDAGVALDAADLLSRLQAQAGVQVGQGLVQQQHPGHLHHGPGDGHALLLAAGHLAGLAIQQLADLHQVRRLPHPALHLLLGGTVLALEVLQGEADVLPHGQVGIQRVVLEHQAHAPKLRGQVGHVVVAEVDLAAGGLQQPGDQVERRGFAAARGPQQADQLAVRDLKAEIVDGDHLVVGLLVAAGKLLGQMLENYLHMRQLPAQSVVV